MSRLTTDLQPRTLTVEFDADLVEAATGELRIRAEVDPDQCYGYFPAMARGDIDHDLSACVALANTNNAFEVDGLPLGFNFLRMSLKKQEASAPFHLDSDAATALTGDLDTLEQRQVWRLLVNMHPTYTRTLVYLDTNPFDLPLQRRGNYVHCPIDVVPASATEHVKLLPRAGRLANAALFCSSQVLHSGQDDQNGHFVAAYGVG